MQQLGGILLCLLQRDHGLALEGGMRARAFSLCFGDAAREGSWLCRVREVLVGTPNGPAFPAADGRLAVGSFPAREGPWTAEAGLDCLAPIL